jgi:hypothetical protein
VSGNGTNESKIAQLDGTVGVDQDVGGLEVTVDDPPRVQVFEGLCQLVDNTAYVDLLENALPYHIVQVGLHVLKYQIDIFVVLCLECLVQFNDVRVINLSQYLYFSVGSLCIR